jgi:hypothetical protein
VRIKGRFARADAPLVAIDKSSAKNHRDIKVEDARGIDLDGNREEAEADADDADADEEDDSDVSEAEDDGDSPSGSPGGSVPLDFRKHASKVPLVKTLETPKTRHERLSAMTGVSELATPDVPPGACA